MPAAYETLSFKTPAAFRAWLAKHHTRSSGIWLRIYKKGSGVTTISYAAALNEALCFGWIDGQKQPSDDESWLQKFTPRRPKGGWSKKNTEHVERLIACGRMTPAGLAEVDAAKADGRWQAAYDAFGSATVPADFLEALGKNARAKAFFGTLNKTNLYSIVYRLQTAKTPETRTKRIERIIAQLAREETFH